MLAAFVEGALAKHAVRLLLVPVVLQHGVPRVLKRGQGQAAHHRARLGRPHPVLGAQQPPHAVVGRFQPGTVWSVVQLTTT